MCGVGSWLNNMNVVSREISSDSCWVMFECMMLVWCIDVLSVRKIVGSSIVSVSMVKCGVFG